MDSKNSLINFESLLINAVDTHVHSAPCIFERWGDGFDLLEHCEKYQMGAVVLKSHHGSTVEMAQLANRRYKKTQAWGGITLNHFVGGLNLWAVDAAVSLGAKIVWLPTIHSQDHARACGCLGGFHFQKSRLEIQPSIKQDSISILNDDRSGLNDRCKAIVSYLNGKPVVLATGHCSTQEILELVTFIKRQQYDVHLLVNHVFFKTPDLSLAQIKELASRQVWFENVQLCISKLAPTLSAAQLAQNLLALPEVQWVLGSDSGQINNLKAPQALIAMAEQLYQNNLELAMLQNMLVKNSNELFFN